MPFEPRLFRDDDDAGCPPAHDAASLDRAAHDRPADEVEFKLPAELTALGEQLADDSDHLAQCYPAAPSTQLQHSPTPQVVKPLNRGILRWGGAAAVLLFGLTGWRIGAARLTDADRAHGGSASTNSLPVAEPDSTVAQPAPILGEIRLPTAVFRGLTGAEQEAVLDLMQDGPQGQAQLSI